MSKISSMFKQSISTYGFESWSLSNPDVVMFSIDTHYHLEFAKWHLYKQITTASESKDCYYTATVYISQTMDIFIQKYLGNRDWFSCVCKYLDTAEPNIMLVAPRCLNVNNHVLATR